jgi:hypothetical protein
MSDIPKMNRHQAVTLWNTLSSAQKAQFNEMLNKMQKGELMIEHVNVDENEKIQNISLKKKDAPSKSDKPFYKHFNR